jgi:hypothetical protein
VSACPTRCDRGCRDLTRTGSRGTSRAQHKDLRPWLSVIAGGESLVSHAGGVLLIETARRSGVPGGLSRLRGRGGRRWPRTIRARSWPTSRSRSRSAGTPRPISRCCAQPGVFGPVASDPTESRLIARLATDADDAIAAIDAARAAARERVSARRRRRRRGLLRAACGVDGRHHQRCARHRRER